MRIKMGLMALAFTAMGYGCDDGDTAGTGTIGAQCEGGGDCASAICLTAPGAAAGYCSDECSDAAPCPGNFECTTVGAQDICVQSAGTGAGGNGGDAAGGNGGDAAGGNGGNAAGGNGGEGGMPMGGNGGEGGMPMGGNGGNGGMPMGGNGGNGGMPPGGLDCPGIVNCFVECGQDRDCQTSCVERGTAEDQELFLDYLTCIQNSGGDQEACVDEQTACVGAPPSGDGECPDFYECANRCPDGEAGQQCVQDCFGGLAPDAQNQVLDIVNCVQAVQAENPNATNEDINEACEAEIEVCFGPPPPPGDTNCGPMLDCVLMAGADQEAGQACIAEGTLQARELFNEFAGCFNDNMCMQVECPACADELAACQNDMGGGMGGMGGGMGGAGGEGGMGEGGMGGAPEGGAGGAPE